MAVDHGSTIPSTPLFAETSFTFTLGTVGVDDILIVCATCRDVTTAPTVTDDDTGGNTWQSIMSRNNGTSHASVWWKRATSGTSEKTITVAHASATSMAGTCSNFSGVTTVDPPYAHVAGGTNASGTETARGLPPQKTGLVFFWRFSMPRMISLSIMHHQPIWAPCPNMGKPLIPAEMIVQ